MSLAGDGQNPSYPLFKEWVVKKEGVPIVQEQDWNVPDFGRKWGLFLSGVGASVVRDTLHFYGGNGSCLMTSGNVTGNLAEVKTHQQYQFGHGKYALEMKFIPALGFLTNKFDMGIEPRREGVSSGFLQGRFRYELTNDEWQFESGIDIYSSFTPPVIIDRPSLSAINGTGDRWGWIRMVIDSLKNEYVLFQAGGKNGVEERDMKGIKLIDRGANTDATLLTFALGITGSASNQPFYVTDWCLSKL